MAEDNPRMQGVNIDIRYNNEFISVLNEQVEKINIREPEVDKYTWMVYGRIIDQNKKAIKGLLIDMSTGEDQKVKGIESCLTDVSGRFYLTYAFPEQAGGITKALKLEKEGKEQPDPVKTLMRTPVFITVAKNKQSIIHRDTVPLHILPGIINFREIIISERPTGIPSAEKTGTTGESVKAPAKSVSKSEKPQATTFRQVKKADAGSGKTDKTLFDDTSKE